MRRDAQEDAVVEPMPYLVRYWGNATAEFSWIHMYPYGADERYQPIASATAAGVVVLDEDAVDRERLRTEITAIAAMIAAAAPGEDPGRWATHKLNLGWGPRPRFRRLPRLTTSPHQQETNDDHHH